MINKIQEREAESEWYAMGIVSWVLVGRLAGWVTAEHVQPRGPRCGGSADSDYHITELQCYHDTVTHSITGQIFQQEIILSPDHRLLKIAWTC